MLQLNRAKFSANGSCGYVLKPQCMCQGEAGAPGLCECTKVMGRLGRTAGAMLGPGMPGGGPYAVKGPHSARDLEGVNDQAPAHTLAPKRLLHGGLRLACTTKQGSSLPPSPDPGVLPLMRWRPCVGLFSPILLPTILACAVPVMGTHLSGSPPALPLGTQLPAQRRLASRRNRAPWLTYGGGQVVAMPQGSCYGDCTQAPSDPALERSPRPPGLGLPSSQWGWSDHLAT